MLPGLIPVSAAKTVVVQVFGDAHQEYLLAKRSEEIMSSNNHGEKTLPSKWRKSFMEPLIAIAFIAALLVLQIWVLPKMGVRT